VNAGPNRISSFHVVGAIFERIFQDGSLKHPLEGVQTVNVPVGGGMIFETRLREPGDYPFVTHAFADATKGAVGILRAAATRPKRVQGRRRSSAHGDRRRRSSGRSQLTRVRGWARGSDPQRAASGRQRMRTRTTAPKWEVPARRPARLPQRYRRHADGGQSPDRPDTRGPRRFRFRGSGR
jgi:hypothetical protein